MEYVETKISGERKYSGIIVNVRVDEVELTGGLRSRREVVEHPGGVGVIPVDDEGYAYLVRQFRYAAGKSLLEIPAGKLEPNEEPMTCAVRELEEELGITAREYVDLGFVWASPGITNERLYVFLALGLTFGQSHPEEDEFLQPERVPLAELPGALQDGKTVIAALKAKEYLAGRDK